VKMTHSKMLAIRRRKHAAAKQLARAARQEKKLRRKNVKPVNAEGATKAS